MLGIFAVIGVVVTAVVGGLATPRDLQSWYGTIRKPSWNPPNWIFGPVWTFLYVCMAVSGWRVANSGHDTALAAICLFFFQLALNALWSWLFFAWRNIAGAATEILLMLAAIIGTAALFFQIDPVSGWLMVPYALWVSFASVLNWEVRRLNPA